MITCALNTECERFLAQTFYLVEAESFAQHALWAQHAKGSVFPTWDARRGRRACEPVEWEELNPGGMVTIGKLSRPKRRAGVRQWGPVNVQLSFARIEGRIVGFWHCCSAVADYQLAEEWLQDNAPQCKDEHGRWRMCDASNLHNCLNAIASANLHDHGVRLPAPTDLHVAQGSEVIS